MSDMLAVEQETNNDVRQFLNKINELRNKAPKNEETKHEEHTPDNHEETESSRGKTAGASLAWQPALPGHIKPT